MIKGYKITDAERKYKVGIAANSLEDLKIKTKKKFQNICISTEQFHFQLIDGTIIDSEDYFSVLPAQITLIWVENGKQADTDAERLYKVIRDVNLEYLSVGEKVECFLINQLKYHIHKLSKVLQETDADKAILSSRCEHPEWFTGLDTRSKTKEEYMFRRSQDRIRSYYYKAKDSLGKHNKILPSLLQYLQKELKTVKYFGCYFDRSFYSTGDNELKSLCDAKGIFTCQGRWDKDFCDYDPKHSINPYISRESRIIFQTWNLDHKVEKSRFIIPAILEISHDTPIDFEKIFRDLFTTENLKLVHIVCHDKSKHDATNDYIVDRNLTGIDQSELCKAKNISV